MKNGNSTIGRWVYNVGYYPRRLLYSVHLEVVWIVLVLALVFGFASAVSSQTITTSGQQVSGSLQASTISFAYQDTLGGEQTFTSSVLGYIDGTKFEAYLAGLTPGSAEFNNAAKAFGFCSTSTCFSNYFSGSSYDMGVCVRIPNPSYYSLLTDQIECLVENSWNPTYGNGYDNLKFSYTTLAGTGFGAGGRCTVTTTTPSKRWWYEPNTFSGGQDPYDHNIVECVYADGTASGLLAHYQATPSVNWIQALQMMFPSLISAPDIFSAFEVLDDAGCPDGAAVCYYDPATSELLSGGDDPSGCIPGRDAGCTNTPPAPDPDPDTGGGGGGDTGGGGGDPVECNPYLEVCPDAPDEPEDEGTPVDFNDTHLTGAVIQNQEVVLPGLSGSGPVSFAASCPADVSLNVMGAALAFSFVPVCDFATSISSIIILIGALGGFMIATGGSFGRGAA